VRAIRQDLGATEAPPAPAVRPRPLGHLVLVGGAPPGLDNGARFALVQDSLIGRSADCQISLPSTLVSTEHARLRRDGGGWILTDLGSTNGTTVNRRTVRREQRLEDGDLIQIGDIQLRLTT
jgi:pSer/pThr/pTyr-binding forkhead associated (FHA) protein